MHWNVHLFCKKKKFYTNGKQTFIRCLQRWYYYLGRKQSYCIGFRVLYKQAWYAGTGWRVTSQKLRLFGYSLGTLHTTVTATEFGFIVYTSNELDYYPVFMGTLPSIYKYIFCLFSLTFSKCLWLRIISIFSNGLSFLYDPCKR